MVASRAHFSLKEGEKNNLRLSKVLQVFETLNLNIHSFPPVLHTQQFISFPQLFEIYDFQQPAAIEW